MAPSELLTGLPRACTSAHSVAPRNWLTAARVDTLHSNVDVIAQKYPQSVHLIEKYLKWYLVSRVQMVFGSMICLGLKKVSTSRLSLDTNHVKQAHLKADHHNNYLAEQSST